MPSNAVVLNNNGTYTTVRLDDKISAPIITNPTTTTETVVARWQLPANFITSGFAMLTKASLLSAGTGTVIWRMRIGTAGTTADTLVCTLTTSAAQVVNARGTVDFNIYAQSATVLSSSGYAIMQAAVLGTVTGAQTNVTIVPTNALFISITATISVAAANIVTGAGIYLDAYFF